MEVQDRSRSPSRKTSRVEQVVGRWLRRSRDLGSRSHSLGRDRIATDGKTAESIGWDQRNYPFRLNVQIQRDPNINSHGLTLSCQTPILVQEVTPGGPADGRLVPGDQLVKINNVSAEDLTPEQAAEIIRECQDTLTMTVLRIMLGPKSSFITPEKRAKLKSNPVKVHFAEEVEVNGHTQGNSLLFLPNVLKVYLENGQTKAFKFEPSTTVKDIVMTLKEKLSLSRIEHFSMVLEQQHSISKLLLLHDEERIHQVVQKKEAHDYRCLFRVCFMPKSLQTLLQEDPTAFEYLYLQGVNDVLQERFAVEMRCNSALRLAALHIQERLASCGQSPKTNLKTITKTWGIENFVSSTLLRNMREKDLRKAIAYHMKKSQSQHDSKQKGFCVDQARINYLEELGELKSFGGKSFNATLMLQDRESMVSLLVGARYGVSQVVNHKLSILSTLTEFTSITRIELLPESEKVSLVKIYLQDIKPITLLLESLAAKDISCLIAGYCRVFVDSNLNVFPWIDDSKKHRVSAEEGYVSRCCSDSDDSSDLDMEPLVTKMSQNEKACPHVRGSSGPVGSKRKDRNRRRSKDSQLKGENRSCEDETQKEENDADPEKESLQVENNEKDKTKDTEHDEEIERAHSGKIQIEIKDNYSGWQGEIEKQDRKMGGGEESQAAGEQLSLSETSDSCQTDSHVLTSQSSDSLDALEEDDLLSCSSSSVHLRSLSRTHLHTPCPFQLHPYSQKHSEPHIIGPPPAHSLPLINFRAIHIEGADDRISCGNSQLNATVPMSSSFGSVQKGSENLCSNDSSLCFAELSRLVDFLPSPPEASEDDENEEEELRRRSIKMLKQMDVSGEGGFKEPPLSLSPSSSSTHIEFVFNFDQSDSRCYYKLCSNITPDSAHSLSHPSHQSKAEDGEEAEEDKGLDNIPILQPPPGFGDSSSDEEFFDAIDRFTSPEDPSSGAMPRDICTEMKHDVLSTLSLSEIKVSVTDGDKNKIIEENQSKGNKKSRGSKETLLQLRQRSRKRRSYMETDYTSLVSYPEPGFELKQKLLYSGFYKNLLAPVNDGQLLSSDPELSVQSQNLSPTVSSLTHSEGEPTQLESKPILSKPILQGLQSGFGSHEQTRDLQAPSQPRKQDMEMEPDAMESKSVTDFVKAVPLTITVVRCHLEPDGKENVDRQGDGKEEEKIQEEMGEGNKWKEKEMVCERGVSGNGSFASQIFISEVTEQGTKTEDLHEERTEAMTGYSSKRPPFGAERLSEHNILRTCLTDLNEKDTNNFLRFHQDVLEVNSYVDKHVLNDVHDKSNSLSHCPPPPPPSSPLPFVTVLHKSHSGYLDREEGAEGKMGISTKLTLSSSEEIPFMYSNNVQLHLQFSPSVNDEGATDVGSTVASSEGINDSTNSDSVFEDDEVSTSLNSSSSDKKDHNGTLHTKPKSRANFATADKSKSQVSNINSVTNNDVYTKIQSVSCDYARTINSITAKLGAATSVTSPTFNSRARFKCDSSQENSPNQNEEKLTVDSIIPNVEAKDSFTSPALTKGLSNHPSSPTHFLFQSCSPSIMGRLSASTLRGKIQKLPLYLSRSQETLNKAGLVNVAQNPAETTSKDNVEITIKVTDVHDIPHTMESGTKAESVDSDDSDTTVTGSEVDGEFFVETTSEKSFYSGSKVTEVFSLLPVQTEPKTQQRSYLLYTGPIANTPGPITEPPVSIVNSFHRDTSGLRTDIPGPIKNSPESKMFTAPVEGVPYTKINKPSSSPPPLVVTTQTLNGAGLPFPNQSQKASQMSSNRPLIDLCRPSEQKTDSSERHSLGCKVFTICEGASQTKAAAEVGSTPPLKSEFGCSSVIASGCESVVEGVQVPLDACGCPAVYTNCFSGGVSFDDELTVYEFSCRTQSSGVTQTSAATLSVMASSPVPSFLSTPTTDSPSLPRSILFSSSTSELSPLLSPLSETSDCFLSRTHKDTIKRLGKQHYPEPPTGFQVLRVDVDQLLSILVSSSAERSLAGHGGRHPRDTCPAHFTQNKRVLQIEARRLMSGCQKVVGIGQSPEEMLHSLAESFRNLVELAGICLGFSGCDRCDRRNTEAVSGLADVARSFRDFCLAAERASSKRTCQDLSTKLLAKQCTALTASVFCLTQLFRTLTSL